MRFYVFLHTFFLTITIAAQQFLIQGHVTDEYSTPLPNTVVTLNDENGIIAFAHTNDEGFFSVSIDRTGEFQLILRKLDYLDFAQAIEIKSGQTDYNLDDIVLIKALIELGTAVIVGKRSADRDTITYRVENFRNGFELSIEDLLKQLPGFEIDREGRIKVNGEEISSVLVEGDDLFSNAYTVMTQNMPVQPVEEVELIRNYSKNKVLRGIQKSDEKVLNLKLKEEEKGKWTASATLASTSYIEDMHQLKLNLMNFKSNRKIYSLFQYNNIGIEEMAGVRYLFEPVHNQSFEHVGDLLRYEDNVFQSGMHSASLENNRDNFNKDLLGGLSLIQNLKNDFKLQLLGLFNRTERNKYTHRFYRFHYGDENFENNEYKHRKSTQLNSIAKLDFSKGNDDSGFHFSNLISYQDSRDENDYLFNGQSSPQNADAYFLKTDHQLNYSKRLDTVSVFSFSGKFEWTKRKSNFFENSNFFNSFFETDEADFIYQTLIEDMKFGGFKLAYAKNRRNRDYLEFQFSGEWKQNRNSSELWLSDGQNQYHSDDFMNDFRMNLYNIFLKAAYNFQLNSNLKIDLTFKPLWLISDLKYPGHSENSDGFFVQPGININYRKTRIGSFVLSYLRNLSMPHSKNFYRNYVYAGDRVLLGNQMSFSGIPSHMLHLQFERDRAVNRIKLSATYSLNDQYISSQSIVVKQYSSIVNVLLENNSHFSSQLEFSRFLDVFKSRMTLNLQYQSYNYRNKINVGEFINNDQNTYGFGGLFRTGWLSKFNFSLAYRFEFNQLDSSVGKSDYINQKYSFNANYDFGSNLRAVVSFEALDHGNTAQKLLNFLDVEMQYKSKNSDTQLYLKMNNLFNEKHIETYTITNVSESLFRQRIIPLHILVGCRINLF